MLYVGPLPIVGQVRQMAGLCIGHRMLHRKKTRFLARTLLGITSSIRCSGRIATIFEQSGGVGGDGFFLCDRAEQKLSRRKTLAHRGEQRQQMDQYSHLEV